MLYHNSWSSANRIFFNTYITVIKIYSNVYKANENHLGSIALYSIKNLWIWTITDIIFNSIKIKDVTLHILRCWSLELTREFLPACCWACKWTHSWMTQLSACAYCFVSKLVVTGVSCHSLVYITGLPCLSFQDELRCGGPWQGRI